MCPSHQTSRRPRHLLMSLVYASLVLGLLLAVGQAQVPTTITPDSTLGTDVTQSGSVYHVTGGTRPGNGPNLFHSFDTFSVGTHDTASFSGPAGVANILSRVTGGQQSLIDGRLRSTIPGANLYLLNPNGVLFGPHASLDVSGSFHVSTADFLRFADGATFAANLSGKSTLTVAPPAAFGFLRDHPGPVTIQGSALNVPQGKALSVVAGDVQIAGGTLRAPGGRMQLASVASPGEVTFSPLELAPDLQMDSFARLGRIELSQGALLTVSSGTGAGTVLIRGGRLLVDDAGINAGASGAGPSGTVTVTATESITIAGRNRIDDPSSIGSSGGGTGAGGRIVISAPILELRNAAQIVVQNEDDRSGGSVRIDVGRLTLRDGGQIRGSSRGAGRGADLIILAGEEINMPATTNGFGNGFFSTARASGDGGSILIKAPVMTMGTAGFILTGSVGNPNLKANAGDITIEVTILSLINGGAIDSTISSEGQGGKITITASDAIIIAGHAGLDQFGYSQESSISSMALGGGIGSGQGGEILLQAPRIFLTGGVVSTSGEGEGTAGDILIQAGDVFRSHNSQVTTEAERAGGGRIALYAGRLVQLIDSEVTTTVRGGGGDAGNLTVEAPFVVAGGSRIAADAFGGQGGNVRINAGVLLADPASRVSASSTLGVQGTVVIQAPVTNLSGVVTPLPERLVAEAELLRDRCAARLREGRVGSLVERGRTGMPATPDGVLPGRSPAVSAGVGDAAEAGRWGRRTPGPRPTGRGDDLSWSALVHARECANR